MRSKVEIDEFGDFFCGVPISTEEFSTKITQELKIMKENSHIDKNTFDYLKPYKPKVGRFYLLPKIHKVNNPGRPIVSANGHPTEKIIYFVHNNNCATLVC
jgi:hypothetical protein